MHVLENFDMWGSSYMLQLAVSRKKALFSCVVFLLCCVCGGEFDSQWEETALILAAENGHADCVRLLIDAGADKDTADDVRRRSLLC